MDDFGIKIPDFLLKDYSKEEMSELSRMILEYDKHFKGKDFFCTEGLIITEENEKDYIAAIKKCLDENRTFNDVWGMGELDEDDLI